MKIRNDDPCGEILVPLIRGTELQRGEEIEVTEDVARHLLLRPTFTPVDKAAKALQVDVDHLEAARYAVDIGDVQGERLDGAIRALSLAPADTHADAKRAALAEALGRPFVPTGDDAGAEDGEVTA